MSAIAGRYARAFADVVISAKMDAAKSIADTGDLAAMFAASPALRGVWTNPGIALDQKVKVLDGMVAQCGMAPQTRNFLAVLIKHRRIGLLADVVKQFKTELYARTGFAEADITSSRVLANDERQKLEAETGRMCGKQVKAAYGTDAALIGGAVVRIGSTVYDGSVRGKLDRLKKEMSEE